MRIYVRSFTSRIGAIALACALSIGVLAAVPAGASTPGSISGTVSYNGAGLAGVCVVAFNATDTSTGNATTGSGGTYTISGLAADTYSVEADPACGGSTPYALQNLSSITVTAGATTTTNFALALGGSIAGIVSYSGTGVAGVCLFADNASGSSYGTATTGSGGSYTIEGLAAGAYSVEADPTCSQSSSSSYAIQTSSITVAAGATTTSNVALTLGGSITGTVSYDGTGVAGACLFAYNSDTNSGNVTTGSGGTYTIYGLPAGAYSVQIDAPCTGTPSYALQNLSSITVTAGTTTTTNVALALGGSISGTVSYGGNGVAGVCVSADNASDTSYGSTTTGPGGTYTMAGLAAGTYSVEIDPTCFGATSSSYAIQTVSLIAVTAGTTTTTNVALALGGSISGTVSYNGTGVAGVCISAAGDTSAASATTGAGGTYSISGLAAGTYLVEADTTCAGTTSSPYATQIVSSITVTAGSTTTSNFALALGGSISGTVRYNGTGVAGVCVFADTPGGGSAGSATTGPGGSYTMSGLAAGTYEVEADPTCVGTTSTSYALQTVPSITVTAGTTTTSNFALALGGSISGTVRYNGTGVAGVCLFADNAGDTAAVSVTTGSDGTYTMPGFAAGTYSLEADPTCDGTTSSSYSDQTVSSIIVTAGATTITNVSLTLSSSATAPGAPTGVTASASDASATVNWTAPASTGGSAIIGYTVSDTNTATSITATNVCASSGSTATSCTVNGLTNGDAYTFTVAAINTVGTGSFSSASSPITPATAPAGGGGSTGGSGGGGGSGGAGTSTTPSNAPAPAGLPSADFGTPDSTTVSASAASTLTATTGGASTSLSVPIGALPAGTTLSVYPVTTSLASDVPSGQSYVAAFAVSWQTTSGTSPDATSPIAMTITDSSIVAGDAVYILTSSGLTEIGTAASNGTITFTFSSDPVFVLTSSHVAAPPRPGALTAKFSSSSSRLTTSDRAALNTLAKKLTSGATVVITGYAKGNVKLARARALAVRAYLSTRAKVHVIIKTSTTSNKATVVTTKQ